MPEERVKWRKIARADSRGKILDLTDPDPVPVMFDMDDEGARLPKLVFNYRQYDVDPPHTSQKEHQHFINLSVLRVLAFDLATGYVGHQEEQGFTPLLHEFKGGPAVKAGVEELGPNGLVSRSLLVQFTDKLRIGPVYQFKFELKEGVQGDKGQITPVPGGKTFLQEFINLSVPHARAFGMTIQSYLAAKDTVAMLGYYR